jgi:hypothetical protein
MIKNFKLKGEISASENQFSWKEFFMRNLYKSILTIIIFLIIFRLTVIYLFAPKPCQNIINPYNQTNDCYLILDIPPYYNILIVLAEIIISAILANMIIFFKYKFIKK